MPNIEKAMKALDDEIQREMECLKISMQPWHGSKQTIRERSTRIAGMREAYKIISQNL